MADKEIKIRFTVDDNGVVTKIDGIEDAIKKTGKAAEKSTTGFSKFQANLVSLSATLDLAERGFNALQRVATTAFSVLDTAQQVENLTRSFENLQDSIGNRATDKLKALQEATQGLVSDQELLQQSNQAVLLGVDDGSGKFEELAAAALKLGQAQGITATSAIESLTVGIGRQSKQVLDNLGIIVEAEKAYQAYALSIGKTVDQLSDQERRLAFNTAAADAITTKVKSLSDAQETSAQTASRLNVTIKNLTDRFATAFSENENLRASIDKLNVALLEIDIEAFANDFASLTSTVIDAATAFSKLINLLSPTAFKRSIKDLGVAFDIWGKQLTFFNKQQDDFIEKIVAGTRVLPATRENLLKLYAIYEDLTESYNNQTIKLGAQEDALRDLNYMLLEFEQRTAAAASSQENFTEIFINGASKIKETEQSLKDLGETTFDVAKYNEELEDAVEELAEKLAAESGQVVKTAEQMGQDFIQGIIEGASGRELAAQLGGNLGYLLTDSEIGQVLGEKAGEEIFDIFEKAFGGRQDEAANARENFFQFLRDSIGKNEALVLIENEFKPIGELFSDLNRDVFDPDEGVVPIFENLFALAPEIQSTFFGVAEALTQLFDDVNLNAGQVAALLAENLGGSLNNLQVLVNNLGISFEELETSIISAAQNGEISFLEAETALRKMGQLAEQGIPDQVGAVTEAFLNLKKAGEQGGAFTIDALRDIGAEAQELGAQTLQELETALVDAGVATDDLQKFFESLTEVGIQNVEQLANATDREAIQILADLETLAFGFLDTTNAAADDLIQRLENIPDQIESRIVIDVETRARDQGAQQVIDSGALGLTL